MAKRRINARTFAAGKRRAEKLKGVAGINPFAVGVAQAKRAAAKRRRRG